MYLERLSSAGITNSEYYTFKHDDNDMPNCTRYADGRAKEASEDASLAVAKPGGGFGHAKTWYNESPLPKGTELKNGSVAVFDGNYGHVAFVERVIDSTHALITDSRYNEDKSLRDSRFWRAVEVELVPGKATISGVGKLIGFLYPPIDDIRTTRDYTKDQVEITETFVNVRKEPSLSAEKYDGRFCPVGIYDVLAWKEADGYIWAKLDNYSYVACGTWSKIYKKDSEEELDIDAIKQLKSVISELQTSVSKLQAENAEIKQELEKVNSKLSERESLIKEINKMSDI